MKKNIILIITTLLILITTIVFYSCRKDNVVAINETNTTTGKGKNVDYTNTDPTWTQITSPILLPAKWGAKFVPAGYTAGIYAPFTNGKVIIQDTTIVLKWHLHVGLRNFNALLKPDIIDYRYIEVNAIEVYRKPIPNGGVMGDYDFQDTIKVIRNGYYNGYFPSDSLYNWNAINGGIHSKATNGWIDNPFFAGILK